MAPNDPDHRMPLTHLLRSGSMYPLAPSTYELVFAINNMQHRAPLYYCQQRPSLLLLLTAAVSPAPSSFITQSTLSMTTPSSTSTVVPTHPSTCTSTHQRYRAFLIASSTPSTSSTAPSTQQSPANSDISTSTTSPILCHLQRPHDNPSLR